MTPLMGAYYLSETNRSSIKYRGTKTTTTDYKYS